jgi:hypothetical protein
MGYNLWGSGTLLLTRNQHEPGGHYVLTRIDLGLIPVLYQRGKARGIPMTRLVDRLLFDALEQSDLPPEAVPYFQEVAHRYRNPITRKEAS